jgi:hypothetical protein
VIFCHTKSECCRTDRMALKRFQSGMGLSYADFLNVDRERDPPAIEELFEVNCNVVGTV